MRSDPIAELTFCCNAKGVPSMAYTCMTFFRGPSYAVDNARARMLMLTSYISLTAACMLLQQGPASMTWRSSAKIFVATPTSSPASGTIGSSVLRLHIDMQACIEHRALYGAAVSSKCTLRRLFLRGSGLHQKLWEPQNVFLEGMRPCQAASVYIVMCIVVFVPDASRRDRLVGSSGCDVPPFF